MLHCVKNRLTVTTWNIPIVDRTISVWFSMRVYLVKISRSMGMFTEWFVEPRGVWSAQPGGYAGIAHTWFFETSWEIQTLQSQKLKAINPTLYHQSHAFWAQSFGAFPEHDEAFRFKPVRHAGSHVISVVSISYRWGFGKFAHPYLLLFLNKRWSG